MARITVVKHKRPDDFRKDLIAWAGKKNIRQDYDIEEKDLPELFRLLSKFSLQIDSINEIQESVYYITDDGLPDIAVDLIKEYIKEDSHYLILDNIEVFREDNLLVVITE